MVSLQWRSKVLGNYDSTKVINCDNIFFLIFFSEFYEVQMYKNYYIKAKPQYNIPQYIFLTFALWTCSFDRSDSIRNLALIIHYISSSRKC